MKSLSIALGFMLLAPSATAGITGGGSSGGSSGGSGGNGGKNLNPNITMISPGDELFNQVPPHESDLSSTAEIRLGLSVSDFDALKYKMEKDLSDVRTISIEGQLYDLAAIEENYMIFVSDDGQSMIIEQSDATEAFRFLD